MLSSSIHRLEVTALCKILKHPVALMMCYLVSVLNRALWNGACGSAEKGLMILVLMMTQFSSLCADSTYVRAITEAAQKVTNSNEQIT
jgi:uncharacterized membrane protein YiaA